MIGYFSEEKKAQYLQGLNEALAVHPAYLEGMCFYDLYYQQDTLVFLVKPTSITSSAKALSAFKDIANILTLSGDTARVQIAEGQA